VVIASPNRPLAVAATDDALLARGWPPVRRRGAPRWGYVEQIDALC